MTLTSPGASIIPGNYWSTSPISTVSANGITTSTVIKNQTGNAIMEIPPDGEFVKINGALIVNGENIDNRLKRIEDMLHIPQRDVILEEKYEKLKQLWQEYSETLNAIKTWETIKESS